MATLIQVYDFSHKNTFIARTEAAIVTQAIAIANEAPATVNHTARAALAQQVLRDPARWAPIMALGICADAAVQADAAATDGPILAAVAAMWNAYAGTPAA